MVCKDKNKECQAFLSFEYICKKRPICVMGKIIYFDDNKNIWYSEECRKYYSSIEMLAKDKKG